MLGPAELPVLLPARALLLGTHSQAQGESGHRGLSYCVWDCSGLTGGPQIDICILSP
jgi:hypothetical protein